MTFDRIATDPHTPAPPRGGVFPNTAQPWGQVPTDPRIPVLAVIAPAASVASNTDDTDDCWIFCSSFVPAAPCGEDDPVIYVSRLLT